jgi:hypothetical protein
MSIYFTIDQMNYEKIEMSVHFYFQLFLNDLRSSIINSNILTYLSRWRPFQTLVEQLAHSRPELGALGPARGGMGRA